MQNPCLQLTSADTLVSGGFQFTTNLTNTGDDLALRECIPLLACLTLENKWWNPNMSTLFDGSLRPYLSLSPRTILRERNIYLSMEQDDGLSPSIIRYATEEPIKLKKDLVEYYKAFDVDEQLMLLGSLWRAWCAQFGLRAIQRSLSKHKLARMSRVNLVRLFVLLTSLLKTISDAKVPFTLIRNLFIPGGVLASSELLCHWDRMRTHLLQVITYNLRLISPRCFPSDSAVNDCFVKSRDGLFANRSIFLNLNKEIDRLICEELPTKPDIGLRASKPWYLNDNLKITFLDMPSTNSPVPQDPYLEACLTSETCSEKFEDLAFAFAGCTLDDLSVDKSVPIAQTFESYNGVRSRTWTINGNRLPYDCVRSIIPPYLLSYTSQDDEVTNEHPHPRNEKPKGVHCGYTFLFGDFKWRCYTCELNQYDGYHSVLCYKFYVPGDHAGHVVESTTNRVDNGSFCDCGDVTAWKLGAGNLRQPCDHHTSRGTSSWKGFEAIFESGVRT
jgi:hypothetical protein